jgi:hypothetical protein
MARLPFRSFPKAVEFNIETLTNLIGTSGFFCISPSTWELAYSLILGYGYWRSRYYFRDPTTGELQDITDDEFTEITNIVDTAIEEFQMAGCEDLVLAVDNLTAQVGLINTNVQNANDCGCDGTSFDESELNNGDIQEPGQAYLDGKCRTANVLHDRVRNFASTMDTLGVDNILNLGVGLATSIVAGLVLAGPGGWATLLVIGVVSGILLLLVDLTAGQFGDLVTELDENQGALVCALFTAGSAIEARESYLEVLDAQAVGAPAQQIVAFMLTNSVTNQLFVPSGAYLEGTDWLNDGFTPTDCDNCAGPVIFARLPEFPNSEEKGGTGDLTLNNAPRDLTATLDENGFYYVTIKHVNHGSEFSCNYQGTSLSAGDGRGWAWYEWDGEQNVLIDEAEESQDPMPPQVLGNVSAVVWIGVSSFTVTVRLVAAT